MRRTILAMALLVATWCGGCRSASPDPQMTEPETTETTETANPEGEEVRGVAQNAKGGAVLLTEDGRVIYIDGLDAWPDDVSGEEVVATGRLEQTDYIPDPVVTDSGAITAGAAGQEWVLRDAEWSVR